MSQLQNAQEKLQTIQQRIASAAREAGRAESDVTLIGASKKQTAALISLFAKAGLRDIGENYLQEAITKQAELQNTTLNWHFIGQIQSNKTKPIARHFSWVHGVDRPKIALRLARQNTQSQPLNLLIQLNLDDEDSKGGVLPGQASDIANQIAQSLAELEDQAEQAAGAKLRGFMAIPQQRNSPSEQRATFAKATELLHKTNQQYGLGMTELSMGMSGDLEAAIAEGATLVRIGTDLFGARE